MAKNSKTAFYLFDIDTKRKYFHNMKNSQPLRALKSIFEDTPLKDAIPINPSFGLRVIFRKATNLSDFLQPDHNATHIDAQRRDYYAELMDAFEVIAFENAFITHGGRTPRLSNSKSGTTEFIDQDPFHRDALQEPKSPKFYSVLHKPLRDSRLAPTIYALESAIRRAASLLPKNGLSPEMLELLSRMERSSYDFILSNPTNKRDREIIRRNFPRFTEAITDLIPQDQKYIQHWRSGESTVVMHSNTGEVSHARPLGTDTHNFVGGRLFYINKI